MTITTAHLSVSLDGFVAGPDQTYENPLGRGGMALHRWHIDPDHSDEVDARWAARILPPPGGAYVMGRNMYGPVRGEWSSYDEGRWRGWWGEDPPYHAPVFVLTHHEHEPIEMAGGTTFHFVTGGFDEALRLAREAGNGNVDIAGGASAVRQALASGELDELTLDVIPVLLHGGERIFDGSVDARLELLESEASSQTTHVRYAVKRPD